jgi:hypothetical protein
MLTLIGKEVHEIKVTLRERDKLGGFLQTAFVSILGAIGLQFVTSVWWASSVSNKLENSISVVADHEVRLREHQRFINKYNGGEPR